MAFIIPPPPPPPSRPKTIDKATKDAVTELADFLAEPAHEIANQLGYIMPGKSPINVSNEPQPMPTETVWK